MAVGLVAVSISVLTYLNHRGWTAAKVARLIDAEFDPTWSADQLRQWAQAQGFDTSGTPTRATKLFYHGPRDHQIEEIRSFSVNDPNCGVFSRNFWLSAYFYYDENGNYLSYSITSGPYVE